ncbi:MAG: hypothetical protein K2W93_05370, partial [Burkholderiaceae bacterium]|nr:hypothetical protein [Burkholderiaceae bacterium]
FVLYGMRFKTRPKRMTAYEEQVFAHEFDKVRQHTRQLGAELMPQREWLDGFLAAYRASAGPAGR